MDKVLKSIITLIVLMSYLPCVFAQTSANTVTSSTANSAELARVTKIGQKLLSANNLPTKITFIVSDEEDVNAYANVDSEIHVYKGLLNLVETDDELASVIGHEIGHIANRHIQKQSVIGVIIQSLIQKIKRPFASKVANGVGGLSLLKVSRDAEYEADLTGADLMIGAGYDPKGMLSLLNKIAQNYIDVIQTHPSGNKRLQNVYDYLSFNYPATIKTAYNTDSYKKFTLYIDEVIKDRNSDPEKMAEYTTKQTKLRNDKLKRAETIQNQTNVWASVYGVIQSTATQDSK